MLSKPKLLETIKIQDGVIFHLDYHQRRVERSLKSLSMETSLTLATHINPPPTGLWRCRIVYDANDVQVKYIPYEIKPFNTLQAVIDDTIVYPHKFENRDAINLLRNKINGADDIVIVKQGYVTDTSIANLAFFDGTLWHTPKKPLLHGTTRARLIDEGKLKETQISLANIKNYSKIAIMNAMLGFVEIQNGILLPK